MNPWWALGAPIGILCIGGGCRHSEAPAGSTDGGADAAPATAAAEQFASPAARCGQCHRDLEAQWRGSAHGRSQTGATYVAMRGQTDRGGCDACHAPLDARLAPDHPAQHDGVDCDVCHTMNEAPVRRFGGAMALHLDDNTKYGPLCDAKNNYFHKVACSPLYSQSQACAGCHLFYERLGDAELPVFTEYEEWQTSRYEASGITCQDCHMPDEASAVAVGAKKRSGVSNHSFASDVRFRRAGLHMQASVSQRDKTLVVHVKLQNDGAGHSVPTGLPERRLELRAVALDASGSRVDEARRVYARVLNDAAGGVAPFYAATRVGSDTRIRVDETREEELQLNVASAMHVSVELVWQSVAAEIVARVPGASTEELVLFRGTVSTDGIAGRAASAPVSINLAALP